MIQGTKVWGKRKQTGLKDQAVFAGGNRQRGRETRNGRKPDSRGAVPCLSNGRIQPASSPNSPFTTKSTAESFSKEACGPFFGRELKGEPMSAEQNRLQSKAEESMVTQAGTDMMKIWREFRNNPTDETRNFLIENYLPLVKYNAERIWARLPDGVDLDDLISAGVFGLMDAINAFDTERGVKFETYCVPRIRGAMLDELRTMDWVPRLVRSKATKMEEVRKSLEAELKRPPTPDEMASKLGVPLEDFYKMMGEATAISQVSLNKKWYETDSYKDVREIDILEDKRAEDPTKKIQNRDLMRMVTKGLNRNERLIIILYYYEDMTMKEIGATLDLSESDRKSVV